MTMKGVHRRIVSGSVAFVAIALMLNDTVQPPVAKAQAAAVAVPLVEALVKAAPSISSFFQKLFPKANAKPEQNAAKQKAVDEQNGGKKLLDTSITREKVLAKVMRASSGAASGTASMSQAVKNLIVTTDADKVMLRQMWSDVSNRLKNIAKATPNTDSFLAGSEQKLALDDVIDDSGSMPEEVLKEIEGKDAASCEALRKSLSKLGSDLLRLNNAAAEELNVIADSLATLSLPQNEQTPEKGKQKADGLAAKAFVDVHAID